mgnify:CR=1 FL=1
MTHAHAVSGYDDTLLLAIYQDLKGKNYRDYRDTETRWKGQRLSAIGKEIKKRKSK